MEETKREKTITLSQLWYSGKKIFKNHQKFNETVDDVLCLLECSRKSLKILASEKGLVCGKIQFKDGKKWVDCEVGHIIPGDINRVSNIICEDALFILLVEKEASYHRIIDDMFHEDFPCIIITGKGQSDVATRRFLKKIVDENKIPVYCLVDCDPYGIEIYNVYTCGSKGMSYDNLNLAVPGIKLLGVMPEDLTT
ncbi:hypothetical protein AQUCO_00201307v1 [Aquilegia coerulea]|uniref:Topoisomerase 6 subunit A/Spo11 TOPRIM domain-containing protein n=1 Tax=Aquilegia coerulea TaxID=218851 RepID=A0A2G5F7C4_AQUCA|nr:hypothetical protein AQUCO_00201307v1 [Aquilegia coerulea]